MADWYTEGRKKLIDEYHEKSGISRFELEEFYHWLSDIGVIDYDIEKDVILDRYPSEEDNDG